MRLLPFDRCKALELTAAAFRVHGAIHFRFEIRRGRNDVVIPSKRPVRRSTDLWSATCFHAFVGMHKASYVELDFSPSGEWSAFHFRDYRTGMRETDVAAPVITFEADELVAAVDLPGVPPGTALGLAASIEHESGIWSYWALAHVHANRPDLHARDCFIAQLP